MSLATVTLLCSQTNVENYLSAAGVRTRLDDDRDGNVDPATEQVAMTDALTEAAETCYFYLLDLYADSILATSNLVNRWATILAAYRICSRRGNEVPPQVVEDASKVEEKMTLVHEGRYRVPNVPLRRKMAPVWSNTRLDVRYQFRVIRVERLNSSRHNASQLPQNQDYVESSVQEAR